MSDETKGRFLRMILPFRLHIDQVDSTFKLNQNKPADARVELDKAISDLS